MTFLVIALLLIALGLLAALVFIMLKRRYTKAKFAFVAFWALSALSMLIVVSLLAQESPIQSIIRLVFERNGQDHSPSSPSSLELVLVCFITFLLHNTVHKILKNWDGPLTVEERRREVQQERSGLLTEAVHEAVRLLNRRPASALYKPPTKTEYLTKVEIPADTLP